jgi:hypothetical protein
MLARGLGPALEQAHVTGEPEKAVGVGAGQVGIEHGIGDNAGVSLGQPAGAEGVDHECANGRSRNAAGRFGDVGHGILSLNDGRPSQIMN